MCGVSLSYNSGLSWYCTLPRGHKGCHRADNHVTPIMWTKVLTP